MADIHVLASGGDGLSWRVAMHIAIPNTSNAVAVNHRTALVNSGLGGKTVMVEGVGPGQITTAEKAQIELGAIFEHIADFRVESGGTSNLDLRAAIRELYAIETSRMIDVLQSRLRYYGHTESKV